MTTTKYRCNGCGIHSTCKVENADFMGAPEQCLYRSAREEHVCWKRDCTEEIGAAKFKMTYTYKELDKKVQDLITAGQGQMKRIQELEYRVKILQNSHFQAQLHAHTWRLEEIEKRVRQLDGHTHERFQCDV
jgi:hypothetical protein